MIVVVWLALPESINYLVEKRPAHALAQYNRIAQRLGYPTVTALPPPRIRQTAQRATRLLFQGVMGARTAALWLGYAGVIAAFYFANSWTAKLIADASGDAALGIRTGVVILIGGVLGALLFAALSLRLHPRRVTLLIMLGGTLAFVAYAQQIQSQNIGIAFALALLVGVAANGGVAAFYAISPPVYPTAARATGVGLMIGFGRGVAILAPIFTGYMLKAGWSPTDAYRFFAGALAAAGVAVWLLDATYRGRSEDADAIEEVAVS